MNEICGDNGVFATYVSQCCAQLDTLFEKWRNRPIPPIAHLFLDATYTKVRRNEIVSDCAVFVAVGIDAETGRRMVPGVSVGLSEAAEHWAAFIQSLMIRGMNRPNCITSDDHKGIRKALVETLTGVPWQRCQFHFQQNAQAHVTSVRYRSIAAAHIRNVFNAGNRASARQNALSIFREDKQYKLADWVEENIEECLTVIDCPPEVQRRLRTSYIMESINRQLKRRTNVISIFPSEASLLRIVTAKAMALSDEWEGISAKAYISPEKLQQAAEALQAASSRPANPAA
jgi:transposase-like protein